MLDPWLKNVSNIGSLVIVPTSVMLIRLSNLTYHKYDFRKGDTQDDAIDDIDNAILLTKSILIMDNRSSNNIVSKPLVR